MRLMGIAALGPKLKTSKGAPGHKIYPFNLLRELTSSAGTEKWAAGITYIPIGGGFLYLVGSSTGRRARCLRGGCRTRWTFRAPVGARGAPANFGKPEIFNSDQGSQFTSAAFTGTLAEAGVTISMDGRGRWMDNVFIERPEAEA